MNITTMPFSDTILRMLIYVEIFYCCLIIGFKTFVIVNFFPKGGYVVISYFKILNLPITGSSFARPFAASSFSMDKFSSFGEVRYLSFFWKQSRQAPRASVLS